MRKIFRFYCDKIIFSIVLTKFMEFEDGAILSKKSDASST